MALKISSYNLKMRVAFVNEPSSKCEFIKVKDLGSLEKPFKVLGVHVIDQPGSPYGDTVFVCVIANGKPVNVDLPKSAVPVVRQILEDAEAVQEINSGKVGISLSLYRSEKYKKDNCTSYRFVEIDQNGDEVRADAIPF